MSKINAKCVMCDEPLVYGKTDFLGITCDHCEGRRVRHSRIRREERAQRAANPEPDPLPLDDVPARETGGNWPSMADDDEDWAHSREALL